MTITSGLLSTVSTKLSNAMLSVARAETSAEVLQRAATAVLEGCNGEQAVAILSQEAVNVEIIVGYPRLIRHDLWEPLADWVLTAVSHAHDLLQLPAFDVDLSTSPFTTTGFVIANLTAIPLVVDEAVCGALIVINRAGAQVFTPDEQQWLHVLAAHTAVSLHKARLLQVCQAHSYQLTERNRQLDAFSKAARTIAGELSLDKVLQQIVDSARELIRANYVALGVPTNDGYLDTFIYNGMSPDQIAQIPHLPQGHGLLGAIIHEKRPIRIPHIRYDPRAVGFPDGHPMMESFLGVPIVAAGEVLGNLYLTDKVGAAEFSSDDQKLAEMLAAHAAVAIQNARLYEQVGRLVIVEERSRIGMDLHDGVIQSIYAVGLTLESARLSMNDENMEDADRLLEYAIVGLNDTIRDIRNFILDLRPHRFKGNLYDGLSRLVREFQINTMVEVNLQATAEALTELGTPAARAIFLTTQEAMANVARHARASHVAITVERTNELVRLTVIDDGKGFDRKERARVSVGHGLSNMRARAEELKGTFDLQSTLGQGTRVSLTIPLIQK